MPHSPPPDLFALQAVLAGDYSIEREIGRGGMGVVYLARDVDLDRPVAIKVLPPAYAVRPELRERFLREARTAAKLSHPNIVPVYRADEIDGFVFFVMAYVDGETVGQRVRARGPLPPSQAARMIREVAWALAYAHARGVVHRDVKPDNILIERETGRALVTDFGIALRNDAIGLTDEGHVMGTAQFMSPEQAAGEALDGRSDLYALGVVGYYAVTGELPFDGPTVQSVLAKHLTQPPPPLVGRSGVPDLLASALNRCLGKTPDERWPTGEALADAIGDATPAVASIPAPIRVWLSKGNWFGAVMVIWYIIWVLELLSGDFGLGLVIGGLLPVTLYGIINVALIRRALDAGFGYEDLVAGLRQDMEDRREERRFDLGQEPPLVFKVVRWVAYACWAVIAATLVLLRFAPGALIDPAFVAVYATRFAWVIITAFAGTAFGMMYPGRRLGDRDWIGDFRWWFWHGPLGRGLVRLAGVAGTARTRATVGSRPTEIAIGLAAQDLYDSLPREVQHRFRELPKLVRQLEDEAQALRSHMSHVTTSVSGVSESRAPAAERERVIAELTAARERAHDRLTTLLGALEAIRLDLLRMSAGVGDADSLTQAIDAAILLARAADTPARPGVPVPQA